MATQEGEPEAQETAERGPWTRIARAWPARVSWPAAALLVGHVVVFGLYFWSLDEAHELSVAVSGHTAVVSVDSNQVTVPLTNPGTGFGLRMSPYSSYYIQATGEAAQADTASTVGRIAETMRLAESQTAWSDIRVNGRNVSPPANAFQAPAHSWSRNARSEWAGSEGAYMVIGSAASHGRYTISARLWRPDGSPALLFGLNRNGDGYALVPQLDRSYMLVTTWAGATGGNVLSSSIITYMPFDGILRRDFRFLLTGYLYALVLLALIVGLYPVVAALGSTSESLRTDWLERIPPWVLPAVLAAIGLICTGLVASVLLQEIPHVQDDTAYLFEAKILAAGRFSVPAPLPAIQSFFQEQYVPMYRGQWFAQYPPGAPLVLMVGVLLGIPWLIGPICASLSIAGLYLVGRRLYGLPTGLLAAVLGLLSPFWLFLGSTFMSHPEGLLFATALLLAYVLFRHSEDGRWMIVAGTAAGLFLITRELTAGAYLVPFVLFSLPTIRRYWRGYAAGAAAFAVVGLILLAYNWSLMGNPLTSTYIAEDPLDHPGFGRVPWGFFTPAHGLWNVAQNLEMLSAHLFGWPYCVCFALMAIPFVVGAANRWDYLLLATVLTVFWAYAFYHVSGLMYGSRYYYEALPGMLLLTARGFVELARLPLRIYPRFGFPVDRTGALFVPTILFAALALFYLRFYLPIQLPMYQGYNFSSAAELDVVQRAHVHHALVFVVTTSPVSWPSYGNVFFANSVHLNGDVVYAHDEGRQDSVLYSYFPGRSHFRLDGTTLTAIP